MIDTTEPVKQEPKGKDFAHTTQSFDKLRRLEVVNGDIVFRGQNGARDRIYPFEKACERFWRFAHLYNYWRMNGIKEGISQVRLVMLDLGARILEAVAQRLAGKGLFPTPSWCTPEYTLKVQRVLKMLKEMK